jgi:hypothetical protein
MFGDTLGGHDWTRLKYQEVVDLEPINLKAVNLEAGNLEVVDWEAGAMKDETLFNG